MSRSIWAVFKHLIRNDDETLESQHSCCPISSDGWCKIWQSKFTANVSYNDSNRLPNVFLEELQPIFTRLTDKSLLSQCFMGLTQNQNESINPILWKHCPKTQFCGKRRIEICTRSEFHSGETTKAIVYKSLGVQPGTNFYKATVEKDKIRIKNAAKKISGKYLLNRKKRQAKWKSKSDDKVTYMADAFGLSKEPEDMSYIETKIKDKKVSF